MGDEKFCYGHSKRGVLSMANAGQRHTNNSNFFITFAPTPWLDGSHVVFGHVTGGLEVLDAIEACGTEGGKPHRKVWIYGCGEEDRLLLRRESTEAMASAQEVTRDREASNHVERPATLPHIND